MNTIRLRIILAVGTVCVIAMLSVILYCAWIAMDPEKLAETLSARMGKRFKAEVSLSGATLSLRNGAEVTLRDVEIDGGERMRLAVNVIRARLSVPHLVFGRFAFKHLAFETPRGILHTSRLFEILNGGKGYFPAIDIQRGSLLFVYGPGEVKIDNIEVSLNKGGLNASASLWGGSGVVDITKERGAWKGRAVIDSIMLSEVNPSLRGRAETSIQVRKESRGNHFSFVMDAEELMLPWWKDAMKAVRVSFGIHSRGDRISLEGLEIDSPVAAIKGEGILSGYRHSEITRAGDLKFSARTSEFDYERIADLLPLHLFPDWLSLLLGRQIRDGSVEITDIDYNGTLADLTSMHFLDGLRIRGSLRELSFGACHDENRVENVNGSAELSGVSLSFPGLSARSGSSTVEEVDLIFHDITGSRGVELSVNVTADMDIADFLSAWRASMTLRGLYDVLEPMSDVKAGRVAGVVRTWNDESRPGPVLVSGQVSVEGGAFSWDGRTLESVTGHGVKENFEAPLFIEAEGSVDGIITENLLIAMPDPFIEEAPYDISFSLSPVPVLEGNVRFTDGSRLLLKGTGRGASIEGEINVVSDGIILGDSEYGPSEGVIEGRGRLKYSAGTSRSLDLDNVVFYMHPGWLSLAGGWEEGTLRYMLEGSLDLGRIRSSNGAKVRPEKGAIEARLEAVIQEVNGERAPPALTGDVICRDILVWHVEETVGIDGSLSISASRFFTEDLSLALREMSIAIAGELSPWETRNFAGSVEIDGLAIDGPPLGDFRIPDDIHGKADILLRNVRFYGIPVESIQAEADVGGGVIRIDDLQCILDSGRVSGSLVLEPPNPGRFELDMAIEGKGVETLIEAFSPGYSPLEGSLALEGKVWGSMDDLNGDIAFEASRGRLRRYAVISKILTVTNLYRLIAGERTGILEEGLAYDRITSTITIRDGVARFENLLLESPSIQASSVGSYSVNDRTVDAIVVIQPFETIDRIIGLVPLVNWILLGEERRLVVVAVSVKGDINDPSIRLTPLDTLSRPVTGILLRALRLPIDIVIKPEVMIPGRSQD
ncbi:MAG: AsmA-like C-terminal region-containing protein [Syntrophales bacterium]|nr:AsmA-like C-terminal region-containing protein [Syntrophales bacterium]